LLEKNKGNPDGTIYCKVFSLMGRVKPVDVFADCVPRVLAVEPRSSVNQLVVRRAEEVLRHDPNRWLTAHTAFYGVDLECGAVVITSKLDSAAIIVKKDDMASEFGLEREADFPHERICSLNTLTGRPARKSSSLAKLFATFWFPWPLPNNGKGAWMRGAV
jgi:hypothetical protein